ncbi:MAG: SDR family NAD(P)-dependent oxidoreductase [Pseudomonadales bacterium]|nr:SDR family NAD(P)-dependent oxidoreductase [Pseudomonadales bacterium]
MNRQLTLDETIEVERPLEEVFAYVAEFSRIEEWDPAVLRGTRLSKGAPGLGSEFRIDMKAGFSLHYRVIEWEPGKRMLMSVSSRVFTAREEITFSHEKDLTRVRYVAIFDFPAPLAFVSRLFPSLMDRVGKSAMQGLKSALEDQFSTPRESAALAIGDRLLLPGIWRFTRAGYRSARKNWNPVSAFTANRHALVTGATSGIGEACALALAGLGAQITLVARNKRKAQETANRIRERTGNERVRIEIADLSLMHEVHALADRLLERGEPLDILVNNAGALFNPRQVTAEGLEQSFALLLLAPFILTERLHPLLVSAGAARVVNVLSGGMYSQRVQVEDLQSRSGKYSGAVAYARAKRALMILTEVWADRWRTDGICVNAMHPGWADTPGVEESLPAFHRLTRSALRSPAEGADTIVWLCAATEATQLSGKFWLDREPHPSHVFRHTRESAFERKALLAALDGYLQSNTVQRTA